MSCGECSVPSFDSEEAVNVCLEEQGLLLATPLVHVVRLSTPLCWCIQGPLGHITVEEATPTVPQLVTEASDPTT